MSSVTEINNRFDVTRDIHTSGYLDAPNSGRYDLIYQAFQPYTWIKGGLSSSGHENLPDKPEFWISVANHDSGEDPFYEPIALYRALGGLRVNPLAKIEMVEIPVIGEPVAATMASLGAIFLERTKPLQVQPTVLRRSSYVASNNGVGLVFPQISRKNHRRFDVRAQDIHDGAIQLAVHHGGNISPAAIVGTANLRKISKIRRLSDLKRYGITYGMFPHVHFCSMIEVPRHDLGLDILAKIDDSDLARPFVRDSYKRVKEFKSNVIIPTKKAITESLHYGIREARQRRWQLIQESLPKKVIAQLLDLGW